MSANDKIRLLKRDSYAEALAMSICKSTETRDEAHFKLIPVGNWVLTDFATVALFADWRNRFSRFFLKQVIANHENALGYLTAKADPKNNSVIFLIKDKTDQTVGHIGLSNVDGDSAELDNVLLGHSPGIENFMDSVENYLLEWANSHLGIKYMHLRVLSFNFLAIQLHERCGFQTKDSSPLRLTEAYGYSDLELATPETANVGYTCIFMSRTFSEGPT
jgi:RimJ/RimL family protein N-acetyltransferase